MKAKLLLSLLIPLIFATSSYADLKIPAQSTIEKLECPLRKTWEVKANIPYFIKPNSSKAIGTIKKGEVITEISAETHWRTGALRVVKENDRFKKGDAIYLLTYGGEGFYKISHNGEIVEDYDLGMLEQSLRDNKGHNGFGTAKACPNDPKCWAHVEVPISPTVWVNFKSESGKTGWIVEREDFPPCRECH